MTINLDDYTLRARLVPGLLLISPIGLAIIAWSPYGLKYWGVLAGFLVSFGLSVLLAQVVRDEGKKKEQGLFRSWGGTPTSLLLSHESSTLDSQTLDRYHRKLGALIPINMPSPAAEKKRPGEARKIYESCVLYLRERTRDKTKYPLVYAENVNYGFRRNLWALKASGISLSAFGLVVSVVALAFEGDIPVTILSIVINGLLFVWWNFRISANWVKGAAFCYAERLLGVCDTM